MSYLASIHDLTTGRFLLRCSVKARNLLEAEFTAISKAAFSLRGNPCEMDVRHLHECSEIHEQDPADASELAAS